MVMHYMAPKLYTSEFVTGSGAVVRPKQNITSVGRQKASARPHTFCPLTRALLDRRDKFVSFQTH
jgi:hypothetical protein